MSSTRPDSRLETFRKQYREDARSGTARTLSDYLHLFPGNEEELAAAYLTLRRGTPERLGTPDSRLGPYRILRELGRGGQGTVYLAVDSTLGRKVALKTLEGLGSARGSVVDRFRREALVASALQHPGLCTIYEARIDADIPYIAMQYVEGETLASRISRSSREAESGTSLRVSLDSDTPRGDGPTGQTPPTTRVDPGGLREAAGQIERVALALHAAHEVGVLHRDIKPANIMISTSGEPVLLDFGLARQEDSGLSTLTNTGELFGTPAYMSPEQITRQSIRLDRRTDVWSLGVTLYECVTLKRPFEAATREALYQSILTRDPPDPRTLNPAVTRDLKAILDTALEKDRDRRYQTALALAEDLRRLRQGEPVLAKPVGALGRLARWARRHRVVASLCAILALALVLGTATALWLKSVADGHARNATAALREYERLADAGRLDDLLREADEQLWPAVPELLPGMRAWLDRAGNLLARLPGHRTALAELRARALPRTEAERLRDRNSRPRELEELGAVEAELPRLKAREAELRKRGVDSSRDEEMLTRLTDRVQELSDARERLEAALDERSTWSFADDTLRFRHERLSDLVLRLERLGSDDAFGSTLAAMKRRVEAASTLRTRTVEAHAAAWSDAVRAILLDPDYAGLRITPQPGLVPLGPDPASGWWEFADLQTGTAPERDSSGKLRLAEENGLVFVLLPGGSYLRGTQNEDPAAPNYDPDSQEDERPVHACAVAPFFLSKYEATQAVWQRLTGRNPSEFRPGSGREHLPASLLHPVEQVTWNDCVKVLRRIGMRLPTEAEWEYGCRAGTRTAYSSGTPNGSLQGFANIGDEGSRPSFQTDWPFEPGFFDGFPDTSPVGALAPNRWGFHDMHGNVSEWCANPYEFDAYARAAGRDSDPATPRAGPARYFVFRGGTFDKTAVNARSGNRNRSLPEHIGYSYGVRPARDLSR